MRNTDVWAATKYVVRRGKLEGARDPSQLAPQSRLIATLVARHYDRLLPIHASGHLLDLGCGEVPLYGRYQRLVSAVTCADWNGNRHVDLTCDLAQALPLASGSFDTIILSDVLEHVPEPEQVLTELARLLKEGGKLLLNVPFFYWLHEKPHDYYRYTEWALRRHAERAGFSVLLLEPVGGSPEILADIGAKHLTHLPLVGRALASLLQSLALGFVATRPGRRLSEKSSQSFPLGYILVAEKIANRGDVKDAFGPPLVRRA